MSTPGMNQQQRDEFDEMVADAIDQLPAAVQALLEEVPVIVEDHPTPEILGELGADPEILNDPTSLCGLHTGPMATERTVEASGELPNQIYLFREGIVALAGGWPDPADPPDAAEQRLDDIFDEIVTTLLHEIGHQFGLDEDDLTRLGYE